ncbi:MAG: alginate lyase family protein [Terriglobales bacterium]
MAAGWHNMIARISRMDWGEVRVRLGQSVGKRRDLLLHRLGVQTGSIPLNGGRAGRPGHFFCAASEISKSESSGSEVAARAELLRQYLPNEAAEILREADEICEHRFRLLGYENLRFALDPVNERRQDGANQVDWHFDPVHEKRAALEPWFKIPFLDFAVVGDHKIIWELNRHQHLVTLAKARLLSGDERYTRELMAQWRSWNKANPYPLGINWGSTLEVAFRSLSWVWVDQLLTGAKGGADAGAEFRSAMAPALAFHGRYIERYLSTHFSPNTHLLGEALTLFILGTLYPRMPRAGRWKESGWRIVRQEAGRQVRPDGVYFEQSLHYHVYALDFFLYARLLAARNGMKIPPAYDAVLERMLDVVEALAQAGPAEGFGDDDGGRLWNPRRNRTEQMTDPLAVGALTFSREFSGAGLTEEAIWLFGQRAVDGLARKVTNTKVRSRAFRHGGLFVLADSEPRPQAMVVDAGPHGEGRAGHGHADALSLRLTMDGQRWLVDAGSGVYISKDPADRNVFRGTGAHNTMRVDGADQAVADEPFSWTHIPIAEAENWIVGKSFAYFVGSHNGYSRLADPVLHRRHVLKIAGGLCLIRDVALGQAKHELEIRWHFAPDLMVQKAGPSRIEISRPDARVGETSADAANETRLTMIVPEETVWMTEVSRTLLSPAYGAFQPAPLVRSHATVRLPAETATALLTRTGPIGRERRSSDPNFEESKGANQPRLVSMAHAAVQVYELDYDGRSHGFFFAMGDAAWAFGPWSSDARVLYCRIDKEKLAQLVIIGGTSVAWQEQPLLKAVGSSDFFEWRQEDGVMNTNADAFSVTSVFEKLAGGSRLSLDFTHSSAE